MQIPVSSILQATSPITRYSFHELIPLPDEGEQLLDPVTGELKVERVNDQLLKVTGDFTSRMRLACDRCGEPFEAPAAFTLDEMLEVVHEPVPTEEVDDRVEASGVLDASDLVRQHLLLSLPARRLCGCEPRVSANDVSQDDPRWAALRSFDPKSNGKH